MSVIPLFSTPNLPMKTWPQVQRLILLVLIIFLHIGFIYALLNGLLYQIKRELPKTEQELVKEIFVSLITVDDPPESPPPESPPPEPPPPPPPEPPPPPPPEPPPPEPPPPEPPPPEPPPPEPPPPVVPVIDKIPSDQAIETPPVPPQPPVPPKPVAPPAPAPAPAPAPSRPKTISTGVEYLQAPRPEYPPFSIRRGEEGRVTLRVLVDEKGHPKQVEVQKTSGSPRLDEAARKAVLRVMFKPHIEGGRAISVYAIVPIDFNLNQ